MRAANVVFNSLCTSDTDHSPFNAAFETMFLTLSLCGEMVGISGKLLKTCNS